MTSLVLCAAASAAAAWFWTSSAPRRGVLRAVRRTRRPRLRLLPKPGASHTDDVATLAAALATELRAGRTPVEAWQAVVGGHVGVQPAPAVPGSDPATVLVRWAGTPGWGGLQPLATCWRLADASGAGLADALDRVAVSMRHEHEVGDEVSGQLASVRATAWVLATVPALAVVMGQMAGADPLRVLLGTPLGLTCLTLGAALAGLGWWWLTRQVESVRRTLRW